MALGKLISAVVVLCASWSILSVYGIPYDPVFVFLVYFVLILTGVVGNFSIIPALVYSLSYDYLIGDTFPFITIAGLIVFGSALWLSSNYGNLRKLFVVIMTPLYSQFMWFMMLFAYYVIEGVGASGVDYFAPYLVGNSIASIGLALATFLLTFSKRREDFSSELLSRR